MQNKPSSADQAGGAPQTDPLNPFAGLGAGMGFLQDWMKAAGSAMPNLSGGAGGASAIPAVPSWPMPTLDPQELDKRIQDLKTVQFWLEQNARMIGMTIQGLEVQSMTLSTLKGMNVSMEAVRDALKAHVTPPAAATPSPSAAQPAAPAPAPAPAPAQASAPEPASMAATGTAAGTPEAAADLINPMRWWDTLTQQFSHLATHAAATTPVQPSAPSTPASEAAASASKPAAKKASAAKPSDAAAPRRSPAGKRAS
jgi:hypothetical protein